MLVINEMLQTVSMMNPVRKSIPMNNKEIGKSKIPIMYNQTAHASLGSVFLFVMSKELASIAT